MKSNGFNHFKWLHFVFLLFMGYATKTMNGKDNKNNPLINVVDIGPKRINLRVNMPGDDVFDTRVIVESLYDRKLNGHYYWRIRCASGDRKHLIKVEIGSPVGDRFSGETVGLNYVIPIAWKRFGFDMNQDSRRSCCTEFKASFSRIGHVEYYLKRDGIYIALIPDTSDDEKRYDFTVNRAELLNR